MEITEILESALNHNYQIRTKSELTIQTLKRKDLPTFLKSLALEISNESNSINIRQLAGSIFKNILLEDPNNNWNQLDSDLKQELKNIIAMTLLSTDEVIQKSVGIIISG